jgi:hypothetical protein
VNWLQIIAGPVVGIIDGFRKSHDRKREMKHAIHEKKIEYVREGRIAEVEWNTKAKATSGWIDDYLTIVLSLPLILSFFPDLVPHIEAGFQALDSTPVWYRAAIAVMISAGFGYKKYADTQMAKHYTLPDPMDKV